MLGHKKFEKQRMFFTYFNLNMKYFCLKLEEKVDEEDNQCGFTVGISI